MHSAAGSHLLQSVISPDIIFHITVAVTVTHYSLAVHIRSSDFFNYAHDLRGSAVVPSPAPATGASVIPSGAPATLYLNYTHDLRLYLLQYIVFG